MKSFRALDADNGGNGHVAGSGQGRSPSPEAPIDLEALAERVYRLLLEDMRLARARGVSSRPEEW